MTVLTRAEAEDFLYLEARLIDEGRLRDWGDMFTEDGIYWLPVEETDEPGKRVSLIYDDKLRREERIFRALQTQAPSQDPPSATQHLVCNVTVVDEGSAARVFSSQVIYETRGGDADYRQLGLGTQNVFAARCEHVLKPAGGYWKIALKKMLLLNRRRAIGNLTFIL